VLFVGKSAIHKKGEPSTSIGTNNKKGGVIMTSIVLQKYTYNMDDGV
jgi:hypothetical protein